MQINELRILLDLLREYGVSSYSDGAITISLGSKPTQEAQGVPVFPERERSPEQTRAQQILDKLGPGYSQAFGDPVERF